MKKKFFRISPHLKIIQRGDEFAVYNSLNSGSLVIIDENAMYFLKKFNSLTTLEDISPEYSNEEKQSVFSLFTESHLIIPENIDERFELQINANKHSQNLREGCMISGLVLEMTKSCNFCCDYCFSRLLNHKGQRSKEVHMSLAIARKAVKELISIALKNKVNQIEIGFMGGEPLINWGVLSSTVLYAEALVKDSNITIIFSITTNGSLVSKKIAEFLSLHRFRVSISLDGPADINNLGRIYHNKIGTYNNTIEGISRLNMAGIRTTVLTTISNHNLDKLNIDFVDILIDMKVSNWGLNVEDMSSNLYTKIDKVIEKLLSLTKYSLNQGLNTAGMWYKPIYAMMNRKLSYCSATNGSFLSVETDGAVYPCSRINKQIGHIDNFNHIKNSHDYNMIGSNIVGNITYCIGCELEAMCIGGCLAVKSDSISMCNGCGLTGQNRFACDFIKKITHAILSDPLLPIIN